MAFPTLKKPQRTAFIPSAAGELSPGWLTSVLRDEGLLPRSGEVVGMTLGTPGGGTGMSGEVARVTLQYAGDQGDAPDSVIAKFPTADRTNRGMIESQGAYEREIHFYRSFVADLPVRAPAHFGSAMDSGPPRAIAAQVNRGIEKLPAKSHVAMTRDVTKFLKPSKRRYALLIEDLGDDRTVHDLTAPPSRDQLAAALTELAKVHAHFWGDPRLKGHPSFWPLVTEIPLLQRNVYQAEALDDALAHYGIDDEATRALCNEAGVRYPSDVARVNRPMTLVHGDARSDNLLYGPDGDVAIVDWAMTGFADPGYDVGYLIAASIDPATGADDARALAEHYHQALTAAHVSYELDEIWQSVEAVARCMVVQQTLSLRYLQGGYDEAEDGPEAEDIVPMADLWLPRALAVLGAESSG